MTNRSGDAFRVFKSGSLFISSKGIGWTSWKKRWFVLTRTSLVFFRSDPSVVPQKGGEVNLTLGGIDLNNAGSVVVKEDKKLLTVLFPNGHDGRAFTLKAETLENLYEWKDALENALAQAPNAALVMGKNGIFKNDQADAVDGSSEQLKDSRPTKSTVIGGPILFALENIDGTPSFLEKALRFVEEYGVKVEGILRQAADVDDVERRVQEYEQGKTEFSPGEDAHVIADCIKHVIRELPSPPVPASCCKALLESRRNAHGGRINAMRIAIIETFPEPNRRLLQRILMMMQTVASHKAENRMSPSAVAACMAPLLLRPLLAGHCEIDNDFDVGGDGSIQLLQAAAAANHAQAIVITLLEEYNSIFGEGTISPELYSDTEESGSESEEATDDEESYEEDDATDGTDADADDDCEHASSGSCSEDGESEDRDMYHEKVIDISSSGSKVPEVGDNLKDTMELTPKSLSQCNDSPRSENILDQRKTETISAAKLTDPSSGIRKSSTISNGPSQRHATGHTAEKKKLPMESVDYDNEDEVEIGRLKVTKMDLEKRIAEEVKENRHLQTTLEKRKNALYERRRVLEQGVSRLQEQLQKEIGLRTTLEAGLKPSRGTLAEGDVINLEKNFDIGVQLNQQTSNHQAKLKDKRKGTDSTAKLHIEKSRSKDIYDGAESESKKNRDMEPTTLPDKLSLEIQQLNPVRNRNSKSVVVPANSTAAELEAVKAVAPTNTKRSNARGEGTNSTTSALTKLTNRLNFLKERRTQIACELQNMDKGHLDKARESESNQSLQKPVKSEGSEVRSDKTQKKGTKSRDK